jgi:hypothetical protein
MDDARFKVISRSLDLLIGDDERREFELKIIGEQDNPLWWEAVNKQVHKDLKNLTAMIHQADRHKGRGRGIDVGIHAEDLAGTFFPLEEMLMDAADDFIEEENTELKVLLEKVLGKLDEKQG